MASPTPPIFRYDTGPMPRGPLCGLAPLTRWVVLGWPVVAMWTFALVALRLRGPRPRALRLFAPPGVAACVVAAAVVELEVAYDLGLAAAPPAVAPWPRLTYWTIHAAVEDLRAGLLPSPPGGSRRRWPGAGGLRGAGSTGPGGPSAASRSPSRSCGSIFG